MLKPKEAKPKALQYNVNVRLYRDRLPNQDTVIRAEGDTQKEVVADAVAKALKDESVTSATVHGMTAA